MTQRMLVFTLLVASMFVLSACDEIEAERVDDTGDGTSEEVADDSDDDAGEDVAAAEPEADDATADESDANGEEADGFVVGDTVRMGDLVMRLHSVRWDEGGEFISPDEGLRWLVADIEIENESDSSTSISSLLMFDLMDQDNRSRSLAFMADTEGSLDGELGAGRSMRGDLAWEVRDEQDEWELIFSPNVFGFGQAIFDITLDDF